MIFTPHLGATTEDALVPPQPARFLEFHIEQGPVLHEAGEPYAIVTAIRGGLRYRNARANGAWARPGIRFDLGQQSRSKPAALSPAMADFVARGADMRGDSPRRMLSGGGHDAAAFATAGWESGMVFIRNWDGSHCPEEGMDLEDLARAVESVHNSISREGSP